MYVRSIITLSIFLWLVHTVGLAVSPYLHDYTLPERLIPPADHESLFAMGIVIPLSEADLVDLGMIDGLGDKLGQKILDKRELIWEKAQDLPPAKKWQAYTFVHGIGEKRAKEIAARFDPQK